LSARRALEIFLQAGAAAELVVIESLAGQKEAAEFVRNPVNH
jgi:hypothetical protein